jgi:hypothetical protein
MWLRRPTAVGVPPWADLEGVKAAQHVAAGTE